MLLRQGLAGGAKKTRAIVMTVMKALRLKL